MRCLVSESQRGEIEDGEDSDFEDRWDVDDRERIEEELSIGRLLSRRNVREKEVVVFMAWWELAMINLLLQ